MQDKRILIVMSYTQKGAQGNEIRLALSAWRRFCTFDYHYVVIGDYDDSTPKEFNWVEFIHADRIPYNENQYSPILDVIHKFDVVYSKYGDEYSGFIRMMDDNYAIKPFDFKDVSLPFYHAADFTGDRMAPQTYWRYAKWKTRKLLDRENLTHINYTTHHASFFEFDKLNYLLDRYNMREESYILEDVYYNYYKQDNLILDNNVRLGVWSDAIFKNDFQKAVENPEIKFVCNSIEGWSSELENSLRKIIF